ncbi:hypothetical protein V1525DRAFT_415095 [Lipomyces kononenkoae]|uniref:Uncharacterized protein n=1 Tax=Lipomyces kononenkoae TaxID=34357 RepID=A0ACC3SQB5_LIPKO
MVRINKAAILLWQKSGLNPGVLIAMVKGGLPPAIALSLFQLDSFAANFTTLGYLVAIMSIVSSAMLPRAKFLQTMMFNIFGICIGAGIALLTSYCSVSARRNTTSISQRTETSVTYNSSASAVSAIWLFFNIAISNAFRFKRPQLQVPMIMYSIFANVSGTTAPLFPTMAVSIGFVKKLLEAFLSGFAIATVVNIFIFPVSSRLVVFTEFAGYIAALQGVVNAQKEFLQSLESKDMMCLQGNDKGKSVSKAEQAAKAMKGALAGLTALHGKLHGDLTFAKREFAYGKLSASDIGEISNLLRKIFIPLLGLGSVVEIFERVADSRGWCYVNASIDEDSENPEIADRRGEVEVEQAEWNEIMKILHAPFEALSDAMSDGLLHASYVLELTMKPKDKNVQQDAQMEETIVDFETRGKVRVPGDTNFGEYLEEKTRYFKEQGKASLKEWCGLKGVAFPEDEDGAPLERSKDLTGNDQTRRQLYLILYVEFLLCSAGYAVLDLVKYADAKVESGHMKRKKIQVPGKKRLRKWLRSCLSMEDTTAEHMPEQSEGGSLSIALGQSFRKRKDPEHLPPTNSWQRFGDILRHISHFFASAELIFGFRVACATMCIAIVAFLENTQRFFVEQRLVWAMIMVAIGMTMTTGSGAFGLLARVVGTLFGAVCSFAIWYIAGGNGNTAAVMVLVFVFTFCQTYILVKFPKFAIGVMIMMVTQVLILGYELEVRKLGVAVETSNGQLYYPLYLLAPYRLATVAGGCLVAWIWSYIPYPITAKSVLRRQLGESIYLLANFYSVVHTTIKSRIDGTGGDPEDKNSPEKRLEKARSKILAKQMGILAKLRQHSAFTTFEPTLGGKFPKAIYDIIIDEVQNIMSYMSLMSYASTTFSTNQRTEEEHEWAQDFARVMSLVNITSNEITSLLTLLSSSVISGDPLPPYLQAPPPLELNDRLRALDPEILSVKHIIEPGYAAFAVSQVASKLISYDLEQLLNNVKLLVGEVDFSFHIISTENSSAETLEKIRKVE